MDRDRMDELEATCFSEPCDRYWWPGKDEKPAPPPSTMKRLLSYVQTINFRPYAIGFLIGAASVACFFLLY